MAKQTTDKMLKDLLLRLRARREESVPEHSADCPGPEVLSEFVSSQNEQERLKALDRIAKCPACVEDVAFYIGEARTARLTTKLQSIQRTLPMLGQKLAAPDFISLCEKLRGFCRTLISDLRSEAAAVALDDILSRLESRAPAFAMNVRGIEPEAATSRVPDEAVKALASSLGEEAERQLALHQPELNRERRQHGNPERWFFERLTPPLRERAARVRDYCEEQLEILHAQAMNRCGISSGVGHSKRVLRLSADLLHAFEGKFSDAFPYYAIYIAAYCHDLGMMLRKGEDAEDTGVMSSIRETHGRRVIETIMGEQTQGLPATWRFMGFGSEQEALLIAQICAAHQRADSDELSRLPASRPLFVDGQAKMVSPLALAAIVRLANDLDCHPNRLPPVDCLMRRPIGPAEVFDYLKHEVIGDVSVGDKGKIHVQLRVRYVYPVQWSVVEKVQTALGLEIAYVANALKSCGFNLPPPHFQCDEALFLAEHPYLHAENSASNQS